MDRFRAGFAFCLLLLSVTSFNGCTVPWTQEPEPEYRIKGKVIRENLASEERPSIIGEIATPTGLNSRTFDSIALVTSLADTGGNSSNSEQKKHLLDELRRHDTDKPQAVLESPTTAIVKVKAMALPGALKGDAVDLLVEKSSASDATSLYGGWLLETRLQEYAVMNGQTHRSAEKAKASGPIVTAPRSYKQTEQLELNTGRVLGGAKIMDTRVLALRVNEKWSHTSTTLSVAVAINNRFNQSKLNSKEGVATPKDNALIQLELPPKYRWDAQHFMDVVCSVGYAEHASDQRNRIERGRLMLQEHTTARRAALEFEAVGKSCAAQLIEGLSSHDPEIRFYASYGLAYLDNATAIPILVDLIENQPEFRPLCLVGLTILDHYMAQDALEKLLQSHEPEVRYGALIALRRRDPGNRLVAGMPLGEVARVIEIQSPDPLIVVSLEERPEIVIFGINPLVHMDPAQFVDVNPRLLVKADGIDRVRIVRFQPGVEDSATSVPSDVVHILNGIQMVGGNYSDMLILLDELSLRGKLPYPLAINPRPHSGRIYNRDSKSDEIFDADHFETADSDSADITPRKSDNKDTKAWYDIRRLLEPSGKN